MVCAFRNLTFKSAGGSYEGTRNYNHSKSEIPPKNEVILVEKILAVASA